MRQWPPKRGSIKMVLSTPPQWSVFPGSDRPLWTTAIGVTLLGGTYVTVAGKDKAEELAGTVSGTVLPFSYHPRLELIADPALLEVPELFFNAARLDRSIALTTDDYVRLAAPRAAPITTP